MQTCEELRAAEEAAIPPSPPGADTGAEPAGYKCKPDCGRAALRPHIKLGQWWVSPDHVLAFRACQEVSREASKTQTTIILAKTPQPFLVVNLPEMEVRDALRRDARKKPKVRADCERLSRAIVWAAIGFLLASFAPHFGRMI